MDKIIDNNLDVLIYKNFLNKSQSDWLLNYCMTEVVGGQDEYNFNGKKVLAPRLT